MSILNILKVTVIIALTTSTAAIAATYSTTLNYSGLKSSIEQSGGDVFGTDINVGDTVSITHKIFAENDYWSLKRTSLWVATGAYSLAKDIKSRRLASGERTGDTILSFYNDGLLVATSSDENARSRFVHIGSTVSGLRAGMQFDTLIFSYLLRATTAAENVLNTNFIRHWTNQATYNVGLLSAPTSAVPVPAAVLMLAPALLGFFGFRRKLQA